MKIKLRYVVEDTDRHGNVRLYYRVKVDGKLRKTRLPGPIGSPEFLAAYALAKAGKALPPDRKAPALPKSLRWYVVEYYKSPMFRLSLSESSQRVRRRLFDRLCEKHGHKPLALLEARHVRAWRDAMQETPDAANNLIKALRRLFAFAIEYHDFKGNPAADVTFLESRNPDGHHSWSLDEIRQYEERHPVSTMARLAMALMLYLGQRRSDVILLGRQHVKNGWIKFTQVKNRKKNPVHLELPIIAELQRIIDATRCGDLTFIVNAHGRPFASSNAFGNWFRDRCDEAGLKHCSAHGLRKAASARLGELQCTPLEIMAITGHRTLKEVERYTAAARQKVMAGNAMARLADAQAENKSVPLFDGDSASGTIPPDRGLK